MMSFFRKTLPAVFLSLALLTGGIQGCVKDGPMEEAGEEVDEAVEEAGDEIEEATD